jgi:hypothetical protein
MSRTTTVQRESEVNCKNKKKHTARGNCFKQAAKRVLNDDEDGEDKWLVHGYYDLLGIPNCYQLHAWVETPTKVYHHVAGAQIVENNKRDFFDKVGNTLSIRYYDRQEVRNKISEQKCYGPWDKEVFRHDIVLRGSLLECL